MPYNTGMYVQSGKGSRAVAKEKSDWEFEKTQRFEMRIPPEFFKAIDDWRRRQPDIPSRAEAIRQLVEIGLKAKGNRPR